MSGFIDLTSDDESTPKQPLIDLALTDDENDEDMKLAIAMSLQDQHSSPKHSPTIANKVIDLEADDDLEQAIALSLQPENAPTTGQSTPFQSAEQHFEPGKQTRPVGFTSTITGLDRKTMEAERLGRLKRKREAETHPASAEPSSSGEQISPPPLRRQKQKHSSPSTISTQPFNPKTTLLAKILPTAPRFSFRNPRVLLTSHPSRHTPNGLTAISLLDTVAPPTPNLTLKSILASTFIIDFDWLLPHFNTKTTSFIFVLHAQNAQHRALLQSDFAGVPNIRLVMPGVLGGGGNMHSKIMILFFAESKRGGGGGDGAGEEVCRIVVPSANLIAADWGVSGIMENVVFVVDLPRKTAGAAEEETQFEREMKKQIRGMGVSEDVLRKLGGFDFSATRDVGFVHSMSGSRILESSTTPPLNKGFFSPKSATADKSNLPGDSNQHTQTHNSTASPTDPARTGLLSLHDTINSLGLSISATDPCYPPHLDYITSSLGNLNSPFTRQLFQAACGHLDPTAIAASSAAITIRRKPESTSADDNAEVDEVIKSNLQVYFPSDETVKKSRGGQRAAGTICFQKKWWETNNLIKDILCDCVGERGDGILMHSKILYVRFRQPKAISNNEGATRWYAGWAYVGSGNLSESAWGRVIGDVRSKQPKLTCRNWESGVVIPVPVENIEDHNPDRDGKTVSGCALNEAGGTGKSVEAASDPGTYPAGHDRHSLATPAALRSLGEAFAHVLPVPIRYPSERHAAHQKEPWLFMD